MPRDRRTVDTDDMRTNGNSTQSMTTTVHVEQVKLTGNRQIENPEPNTTNGAPHPARERYTASHQQDIYGGQQALCGLL